MKVTSSPSSSRQQAEPEPEVTGEHEMTTKERKLLERGRSIAAQYLMDRDGLDQETALVVVESMDADGINELTSEAATAVLAKTEAKAEEPAAAKLVGESKDEEAAAKYEDFTGIEALMGSETFVTAVMEVKDLGQKKNQYESEYKARKKDLVAELDSVGKTHVQMGDIKVRRYKGGSKFLDSRKLLEKGVSIDIINACYSTTEYDDVQLYYPKEA